MLAGGTEDKEHAMRQKLDTSPDVIGIDIGKNSFHIVGQNQRSAIVLRQKWSRGQVEARLANLPPCRIGMEACVGAHHLSRTLTALGHDARLTPAKYVRPYSKGQKNDYRDAEAIAEAVQRPTMKFVATKTADQFDFGGHVARCESENCGYTRIAYNSCRNRHCNKCQAAVAKQWLAERQAELLPVPYFHVVFTRPAAIADLAYQSKAVIYDLLFKASSETVLTIAADPKHLGARRS
jgi:hypothetical protein